ncbi:ABC transporter ATP-binding protein [Streptomyces sp. NPDC094038]|uniref:ABC transporter ATP-binding protein n=1 Tax=Streptomyces sp. NPDC094038 TaxID=3366055 RepID=UPI0038029D8B
MTLTASAAPILELRGITKSYGPVTACDAVDLSVEAGEIHGLLGENGAGKSSLMKVLLGLVRRDAGTVLVHGEEVALDSPQEAAGLGIGMVHQHFSLIDALAVWENVALGDTGKVDKQALCAEIAEVSARYGLPIDPEARVGTLSAGERQRVEVVKCLRRNPRILILDEPTSVLTQAESEELFAVLGRVVQEEGRAVILISHKLAEIARATDRVTVLRKGRVAFRAVTAETTPQLLAQQMVGREVSLGEEGAALGLLPVQNTGAAADGSHDRGAHVLRLAGLTVEDDGVRVLDGVELTVGAGEIVALYGVEGNGQATLGDVLSGLVVPSAGTVEVAGQEVDLTRPGVLSRAGLGIVPEDRHQSGVVLDMSVAENLTMKSLDKVSGRFLLRRRAMLAEARRLADEFNIVTPSLDAPVRSLSGGNQQRVVLARELSGRTCVLVAAQPTHGLDVGAIEDMYARLRAAAAEGVGVLLISTELEEVMALASWIAVISSGRITGALPVSEATPERLGMLVGGEAA